MSLQSPLLGLHLDWMMVDPSMLDFCRTSTLYNLNLGYYSSMNHRPLQDEDEDDYDDDDVLYISDS